MSRVRYGVQVEFTVDNILDGGPSSATIRKTLREFFEQLVTRGQADPCWRSLSDVKVKYLHSATSTQKKGRTT